MRFLLPLLALFPFATDALAECDANLTREIEGGAAAGRDALTRLESVEARLAHLEAFPNHDHGTPPPGTPGTPGTPGDAPWPAPPGLTWLRIPEGAQAQDGEAQDVNGRSLRIPDPAAPGFVRALVPASPVAGAEIGPLPGVTFG